MVFPLESCSLSLSLALNLVNFLIFPLNLQSIHCHGLLTHHVLFVTLSAHRANRTRYDGS